MNAHDRNSVLLLRKQSHEVNVMRAAIVVDDLCHEVRESIDTLFYRGPVTISAS